MDQGVPPPPGGYGLPPEETPSASDAPPAPRPRPNMVPPPTTPFRENYYVPPASNGGGKRWAFGGVGVAILGVRLLLMCARLADSPSSSSYDYTPTTYPTYDPASLLAGFDASAFAPEHSVAAAQRIAVTADGHAFWTNEDVLRTQASGGEAQDLGKPIDPELLPSSELVVTDKAVAWLSRDVDAYSLVTAPRAGGAPKAILTSRVGAESLVADGAMLYFTEPGDADDRNLMRVPAAGGAAVKVATWTSPFEVYEPREIALNSTSIYFVRTRRDKTDDAVRVQHVDRVPKGGGAPRTVLTLGDGMVIDRFAVTDKQLTVTYSSSDDGRTIIAQMPLSGGGELKSLSSSLDDLGDLRVDASGVYVARRVGTFWAISRIEDGSPKDLVRGLGKEPHFGLSRDLVVWSTGDEVSSQSKTTTLP